MKKKLTNFCTMPGNPSFWGEKYQDYSEETLNKLKDHGIDTVFINIAWSRPWLDAVVLENTAISESYPLLSDENEVALRRKSLAERAKKVKDAGLKSFALFGMPVYRDFSKLPEEYKVLMGQTVSCLAAEAVTCLNNENVHKLYKELIADFFENVPDVDGFLIYTYDELADICDENGDCPRCHGIPNEIRLANFLNLIEEYTKSLKSDFEIWWEPWEVSWAQVYGTMELLSKSIGISCHSTINEVYLVNNPDLWIRNMASLAKSQGRKLISEHFLSGSGEDIGPIAGFPCPRLIFNQLDSYSRIDGISGFKEYYGWAIQYMSVNEKVIKLFMKSENKPLFEEVINEIVCDYADNIKDKNKLLNFWEITSRILELMPWELSWILRFSNYFPYEPYHWGEVSFKNMMKTPWNTPSWLSNRRSYYMVVDDTHNMTDATVMDIRKRFEKILELIDEAFLCIENISYKNETAKKEIAMQKEALTMFKLVVICRNNHLKLSTLAEKARDCESPNQYNDELLLLLNAEKQNAYNLLSFINSSEIPYYFSKDKMSEGIQKIEDYIRVAVKGTETFIKQYSNL